MTSKPDTPGAAATSSTGSRAPQTGNPSAVTHVLVVKVTGPSAAVTIANTANTVVYFAGTLNHGESRVSDMKDLVVTADPAQNVDIEVNGQNVSRGKTGKFVKTIGPT